VPAEGERQQWSDRACGERQSAAAGHAPDARRDQRGGNELDQGKPSVQRAEPVVDCEQQRPDEIDRRRLGCRDVAV
jgi:hypothetical protein